MSERQSSSGWTEHLAPLTPGWSVWRQIAVRGAGFPAALAEQVRQPESAQAVDALLRREADLRSQRLKASEVREALAPERARLEERLAAEAVRVGQALRDVARMPEFREAVVWQNRQALASALDVLLRRDVTERDSRTRQKEELVSKYLLRYCLKNDTIGFFGPLGWGRIEPEAEGFELQPGPELLSRRQTLFEHWCIDTLAERLSADARLRPWIAPRALPVVRLEGTRAVPMMGEPVELSAVAARALALCDGERTAREIASLLRREFPLEVPGEAEAWALLEEHRQQAWILWTLELPNIESHPERALRRLLERIDDTALRAEVLAPLDELDAHREQVARSVGNAEALARALDALNDAFTARTGEKAQRREGQTYAGRTLLYQDCNRDMTLTLGPALLQRLGPPLGLLLDSARWFTFQVGARYLASFERVFDELRADAPTVDFLMFHLGVSEFFPFISHRSGPYLKPDVAKDLIAELQARWTRLLNVKPGEQRIQRSSAELAAAARDLFAAPGPGWPGARYHAPDLMISASSPEALRRGEFFAVLGELHIALNTLESPVFFFQHPRPEELVRALEQDIPGPRISPAVPKDRATRAAIVPFNRNALEFVFDTTRSWRPSSQVLSVGTLVVERVEGQLQVRTRDGSWRCHVLEFYDWLLSIQFAGEMHLLPPQTHSPRVTIDDMVVSRETWHFTTARLPFLRLHDPTTRFLEARRWAQQHGLPDRVFYKTTNERKPFFLDLTSPLSLKSFVTMARASEDVVITEMLPTTEQLWLTDARGQSYTSELRMVMVDGQPWRPG
ncbi:lantibiotic dehydratase [Cystobacter fuscus]|nr:lantibiotic dehydratase [Cystobacter fuscus]